jgi:parallel beta-helix repeat protein
MKKALRITSLLLIGVLILNIFTITNVNAISISKAKTIIIDDSKEEQINTIQETIDKAPVGSTIVIGKGVYSETINIKKQITLQGEDKEKTIINPISEKNKYAIRLGSPGVVIKNLSISNGGPGLYTTGIKVTSIDNKIEDCNIYDTPVGISIFTSCNTIKNCEFSGCKDEGIILIGTSFSDCKQNKIINCKFFDNCDGIELQYATDNEIINCEIFENTHTGIDAITSKNDRNEIINCRIYNNSVHGIYLHSSSDNIIYSCIFSNNYNGHIIEVKNSKNNEIINPIFESELKSIREMLMNFLEFFQKRYSKARIIIDSIFETYRNLRF